MPFSHRHHHFPELGGKILLDRLIAPSYVLRRCEIGGFLHDERLSARALGYGTKSDRARLVVMLEGRGEFTAGEQAVELGPGDALLVSSLDTLTQRGETAVQLELDWDPGGALGGAAETGSTRFRLGNAERSAMAALASALSRSQRHELYEPRPVIGGMNPPAGAIASLYEPRPVIGGMNPPAGAIASLYEPRPVIGGMNPPAGAIASLYAFKTATNAALGALRALGLPLEPETWEEPLLAEDPSDQAWSSAIDAALSDLAGGPASADLERRVAKSRSTVFRRSREFHGKFGLTGLSGPEWRSVRDFYRLLVGTIVMGHPDAGTREVAGLLGYRSAEAFCHAFANAGLPSPGRVRESVRQL